MNFALKMFRVLACTALAALMGGIIYLNEALPDSYLMTKGGSLSLAEHIEVSSERVIPANYEIQDSGYSQAAVINDKGSCVRTEQLRLFGIFPIKEVTVTEVAEPVVVPCGTPFGIKLLTEGVLVVELTGFDSGSSVISPAAQAGIEEGDIIMSISGKKVMSNRDVSRVINESSGKTLGVELVRDGVSRVVFIKPEKSAADGEYHAGMWVRDSSAGIGTVTFYNPSTGVFAGLGHPVCDADTGEMLTMSSGEAAQVNISGIKRSMAGSPGELIGMFTSDKAEGALLLNCESGIYGTLNSCPVDISPVPVAMRQEVKTGPAVIYSTIDGKNPRQYSIEIEKIDMVSSGTRNMVVRVTDSELIEKAGGIVQGMSGSPIIQDGKLVGAVTHVLVKDPARGYAIFADTMLEDAAASLGSDQEKAG